MTGPKPILPTEAANAIAQGAEGDFLLPICLAKPGLLLCEAFAVIVLDTVEGQRVGVPLGHQALSDLRVAITEALRMTQADNGEVVQ